MSEMSTPFHRNDSAERGSLEFSTEALAQSWGETETLQAVLIHDEASDRELLMTRNYCQVCKLTQNYQRQLEVLGHR